MRDALRKLEGLRGVELDRVVRAGAEDEDKRRAGRATGVRRGHRPGRRSGSRRSLVEAGEDDAGGYRAVNLGGVLGLLVEAFKDLAGWRTRPSGRGCRFRRSQASGHGADISVRATAAGCPGQRRPFSVNSDLYGYIFRDSAGSVGISSPRSLKQQQWNLMKGRATNLSIFLVGHQNDFSGAVTLDQVISVQAAMQTVRDLYRR